MSKYLSLGENKNMVLASCGYEDLINMVDFNPFATAVSSQFPCLYYYANISKTVSLTTLNSGLLVDLHFVS